MNLKLKHFRQKNHIVGFAIFALFSIKSFSQVTLAGAVSGNGPYTTLAAAFTAINGGVQTGLNITVTITGNTTEPAAGATLNAGLWTSLTISPSGGAARTITGAITAGSPLINLNGADNVTINGLNTGGNSLTLSNTTASGTAGTSTIRFMADALNNTVTNCIVLGSYTAAATVSGNGGTINFYTGTTTGNDNNTISNNDIGPAGVNLPSRAIGGWLNDLLQTYSNDNITISGNKIYDYFSATVNSAGILVDNNNTNWIISNNKFYQTASRTVPTAVQHSAIWMTVVNIPTVNTFTISGNIIGYNSSAGTGVYTIVGAGTSKFIPIFVNAGTGAGCLTTIQNNTITAISMSGSQDGTLNNTTLALIFISSGITNITGNTFGDLTTNGAINYTSSSINTSDIYGILHYTSSNLTCTNNSFGSITVANSSSGASKIYCIRGGNAVSTTQFTIQNNIIGGTLANSIQSTTSAAATLVSGIYSQGSTPVISGNTIRNLTAAGGTNITTTSSILGICAVDNTMVYTITNNTIYSLSNTNTTDATTVTGIHIRAGSTSVVSRNFVRSLSVASSSGIINGINIHADIGNINYINNMISLGKKEDGTNITVPCQINGINYPVTSTTPTANFYFNSINICGAGVTNSANNTFAFNSVNTSTQNIKNNIFYNQRSNASTGGKHYAIKVAGTSGLTINYNDYQTTGTGGVLGNINAGDIATLTAWQGATTQDVNSITPFSPLFISDNDLHLQTTGNDVLNAGLTIAGITGDIDNDNRLTPTIGADELIIITPIELIDFNGNCSNNNIVINWTTATETNNNYFTLEKSSNGINFTPIAKVLGKGNSLQTNRYNFIDQEENANIIYYRLKQVDFNGKSTTSQIISIVPCMDDGQLHISIYPNPTTDYLTIVLNKNLQNGGMIELINYLGQPVLEQSISNETNCVRMSFADELANGVYFVIIKADSKVILKQKIIKH